MTGRRAFLRAGFTLSALSGALRLSASAISSDDGRQPAGSAPLVLHKILVDAEVAESVAFGAAAARSAAALHVFGKGDISQFWYDELDLLWRERRAPIAGLTHHGPLFVLERFAWDRGMRAVFRGVHTSRPGSDAVVHELSGSHQSTRLGANRLHGSGNWPAAVASLVNEFAATSSAPWSSSARSPGSIADDGRLFSWVIA
jgi:hypothetical protein